MRTQPKYMYSTAKEEVEARRLAGLNALHNPHTLGFLSVYLSGRKKILELGCGSGHLAAEVLRVADEKSEYIGVDRDLAQVQLTANALKQFPNARVLQLDIVTDFDKLKNEGPFDVIYCRWLLVHLPSVIRIEVIKNILSLLSDIGVFLCDECDNRSVRFKPAQSSEAISAPYEEATKLWSQISKGLMQLLGNDLEYTTEKIHRDLAAASEGRGEIKTEGQYQVVMRKKDQKSLITDGYRSSSKMVEEVCKKPFEKIIAPFDECVENAAIEVEFLTENVVSYKTGSGFNGASLRINANVTL